MAIRPLSIEMATRCARPFALFTVPIVLLLAFYFVAVRGMEVGGGPEYQVTPLLIKTASYMLGGPASGAAAGIAALLAVASIYVVLVYLMFERDDRWIFYAVVIVAPLGLIPILLPGTTLCSLFYDQRRGFLRAALFGLRSPIASRGGRAWYRADAVGNFRGG